MSPSPRPLPQRMAQRGSRPGAPALSKSDYEQLAEFRHLLRQFLSFSQAAAASVRLTAQQHQALLAIKGYPGRDRVTVGELAGRLGVRHHSAVGLIDRLESRRLVRRETGASADRRQVLVRLTPTSERLLAQLSKAHRRELRRLAPLLKQRLAGFGQERVRTRRMPDGAATHADAGAC